MEWLGAAEPVFAIIGLLGTAVVVLAAIVFFVVEMRRTGRSNSCDRHQWSSGPTSSTPAWKWRARTAGHRLRHHLLPGQQPLYATDRWIAENGDALLQMRGNRGLLRRPRVLRGIKMAQNAVRSDSSQSV